VPCRRLKAPARFEQRGPCDARTKSWLLLVDQHRTRRCREKTRQPPPGRVCADIADDPQLKLGSRFARGRRAWENGKHVARLCVEE